jgi:glutathione S-transferase
VRSFSVADIPSARRNNFAIHALLPEGVDAQKQFPHVLDWHKRLTALPYVAEALKQRDSMMNAH